MILHAIEAGEGPPVALLHGLFGRAQNLGAIARHLAGRHRVVSVDLRNHGMSPHVDGMDYPAMAGDVRETLAGLGAWPARVLGHSMGGKVAMMLALLHGEEVRGLIVGDIAPVAYAHQNRAIAAALQTIALQPGLSRATADAVLASVVKDAGVRNFLLQNLVFSETPHWRIGLSPIAAALPVIEGWPEIGADRRYDGPACFIAGAESDFSVQEQAPLITRLFPRATFAVIPNAGHWLHAEQPSAFAAAVDQAWPA